MVSGTALKSSDDGLRAKAVGDVFVACALMVPRGKLTQGEWVAEVTLRFKAAWAVIEA